VKKNRRYSSGRASRTGFRSGAGSAHQSRLTLSIGLILCVLVAGICGRALDQRQRTALSEDRSAWTEGRASLKFPPLQQGAAEHDTRARVERISDLPGTALLSTQRWQAVQTVLVDGVDVSDMLTHPFVLKRSLIKGFRAEQVAFEASWKRPEAFLDLVLGEASHGSVMLRFTPGGVQSFLRSHSGILVPVETRSGSDLAGCERYEVAVLTDDVSLVCSARKVLSVAFPGVSQGRVLVSSNLTGQEVQMLSIKGAVGDVKTEDGA